MMPEGSVMVAEVAQVAPARAPVEDMVVAVTRAPRRALHLPSRGRARVAFARQLAMYLLHVEEGLTLTAAGAAYARDRTTASHACRLVEDRRDGPVLDRQLEGVSAALARYRQAAALLGRLPMGRNHPIDEKTRRERRAGACSSRRRGPPSAEHALAETVS